MTDSVRGRVRQLTRKIIASPTLPLLGWTKAVETVVAAGPTVRWAGYAVVVTALWVLADTLQQQADDLTDAVEDATDG